MKPEPLVPMHLAGRDPAFFVVAGAPRPLSCVNMGVSQVSSPYECLLAACLRAAMWYCDSSSISHEAAQQFCLSGDEIMQLAGWLAPDCAVLYCCRAHIYALLRTIPQVSGSDDHAT